MATTPIFDPILKHHWSCFVMVDFLKKDVQTPLYGRYLASGISVPAYRLLYDDDPSIAARLFRSVLDAHQLLEQRA